MIYIYFSDFVDNLSRSANLPEGLYIVKFSYNGPIARHVYSK